MLAGKYTYCWNRKVLAIFLWEVDGWMGGWVDEWMSGWVDGWMGGWVMDSSKAYRLKPKA
ncbi:hypothetical protein [Chamaesiphon polymorphus]|uniref:Uncharacterized protein n=1 Tax=Chamaesiphon polymorphus CCALA 037 TaxID=2107692 RepID=A0A2T1GK05_9CYAN|nr:hypothetical protein [Chamaesiphon polymorphus]PSB58160.1 hypothetical protein C7B77_05865 [Chamaesiphon polymorphus CCALA 037]